MPRESLGTITAEEWAEKIAGYCQQATPRGDGWMACCPAHDDSTPSLSISPGDEQVLLYCHAGCDVAAICGSLMLEVADLFVGSKARKSKGSGKPIVATYDYVDLSGVLRHQTVRYGNPKDFKQRRPDPSHPDAWIWNLKGVTTILYRLPELHAAIARGEAVYIVEGEKDAESLWAIGLASTSSAMGAKSLRRSIQAYTSTLRGATCYLLPDHHDLGEAFMQRIAHILHGVAASVRLVPGIHTAAQKSDVSDWLAAGGTRAQLEAAARASALWEPPSAPRMTVSGPSDPGGVGPVPQKLTDSDAGPLPYSDYTNSRAFVRDHGAVLRHCHPWQKWLHWTGTHWQVDEAGLVIKYAQDTIKGILHSAQAIDDTEAVKHLIAHVKSSLGGSRIRECARGAQPHLAILPAHMDTYPWYLNCANGTLDLRTGRVKPHDQHDMLTQCLAIPYDKNARCPSWDAFLARIMRGREELIDFLQRAIGYALSGVIREHVLLILWGAGRNGKSTFINICLKLLGPYAYKAIAELLMTSRADRHPTERADLFKKRLVAVVETEQGRRLAETFVKEATGGDPITARRMREDLWSFLPTHKLFMATNNKPQVRETTSALWERLKLVRFTETISPDEMDYELPGKLEVELPGILAWAVRGSLAWQKDGLGEPEEVTAATAGYRAEMDMVGRFLDEVCMVGNDAYKVGAEMLFKAYQQWSGGSSLTTTTFRENLMEKGYVSIRKPRGMQWQRIGLPQDSDN